MPKISRRKFIWGGSGLLTASLVVNSFWYEKFFIEVNEFYMKSNSRYQEHQNYSDL